MTLIERTHNIWNVYKDKTKNIKVTSLILKIGTMTKLMTNSFVRIIKTARF